MHMSSIGEADDNLGYLFLDREYSEGYSIYRKEEVYE